MRVKRVSCSQVLPMISPWFSDHQQVCRLYKSRHVGSLLVWSVQVCVSMKLRGDAILQRISLGNVTKPFPNSRHSSQEWTSKQMGNPQSPCQTLSASLSMLNIHVHDSRIRRRLNKYSLLRGVVRRKSLLSQTPMEGLQNWIRTSTTALVEQCAVDRCDQSGDVWP